MGAVCAHLFYEFRSFVYRQDGHELSYSIAQRIIIDFVISVKKKSQGIEFGSALGIQPAHQYHGKQTQQRRIDAHIHLR